MSGSGTIDVAGVGLDFDGVPALRDTDLHVESGEFFTLLGPSGSGKTTLLRIIAGLLDAQRGTVSIDGVDVTGIPIQKRDIGFVFQNYALFPYLTVAENIEFGLKLQRVSAAGRAKRVAELIELVALGGLAKRYPGQLSGGQQQRVALARALARRPRVLLLDEPLGALDRRLRQEVGAEIRRIQRESETTALYVTHDQEEAFILSDRIGVMNGGVIRQTGAPHSIYVRPADLFVARFLGETNLFDGIVLSHGTETTKVAIGEHVIDAQRSVELSIGSPVFCAIRPEHLLAMAAGVATASDHQSLGAANVTDVRFLGQRTRLNLNAPGGSYLADMEISGVTPSPGTPFLLFAKAGSAALVPREHAKTDHPHEIQGAPHA